MPGKVAQIPRVSYSQNGEDILLDRVFGNFVGSFMDLGASHPRWDSNTCFFHQRGWHGTNVEPNPRLYELFQAERPDDCNLNLAVSDHDGELAFFDVVDNIGLSTLAADVAAEYRRQGFHVEERPVHVRTVASLIGEFKIEQPDFLSLDVEAHEGAVLSKIPLEWWRPKVLVIESTLPRTSIACHQGWEHRLIEHGYIFAAFNGINRFYLRDDFRWKLECFRNPVNAVDDFQRSDLVAMRSELEAVATALDHTHIEREHEHKQAEISRDQTTRHAEELNNSWEWGRRQAELAQERWQQECVAFHQERLNFEAAHIKFENERAYWSTIQQAWDTDRVELERLRSSINQIVAENGRLADLVDHHACEIDRQSRELIRLNQEHGYLKAQLELERSAWQTHHGQLVQQIEESRREHRPYALIDRFGVVSSGYGLARKIKHKIAAEIEH